MILMLMVWLSLMANHVSTSGPLQQQLTKHQLVQTDVHVPRLMKPTLVPSHPMFTMTTSVILALVMQLRTATMKMTHCGMGRAVAPPAHAVDSTTLRGSARPSLSQPLMTLSWGCVLPSIPICTMRTLQLNWWRCLFSRHRLYLYTHIYRNRNRKQTSR